MIALLGRYQIGQRVRNDGPQSHLHEERARRPWAAA